MTNERDDQMTEQSAVTAFRPPAGLVQPRASSASQTLRAKLSADLKGLQGQRERLLGQLYELKAQLDDVDMSIDNLANTISRFDREALLKANPGDTREG